jgi:hypothetical protein
MGLDGFLQSPMRSSVPASLDGCRAYISPGMLVNCPRGGSYKLSTRPRISRMISSVPPPIGPRRASRTARSTHTSRM